MKMKLDTEQKASFKKLRAETPGIEFFHAGNTTIAYACDVPGRVYFATCAESNTSKKWREYEALVKFERGMCACLFEPDFDTMLDSIEPEVQY